MSKGKEALERLNLAIGQDKTIICSRDELNAHAGNDPEYLSELGLEEQHLKKLEKLGYAFKAYTKNIWAYGEELPSGHIVEAGATYRGKGSRLKWLLIRK